MVYTETIIIIIIVHLGVSESGEYLPHCFVAWQISTTIHLHRSEQ